MSSDTRTENDKRTETEIHQTIIDYLSQIAEERNLFYFAPLNETAMMILKMFKVDDKTCYKIVNFLKKMGLIVGNPDIWVFIQRRHDYYQTPISPNIICFEVKDATNTASTDQKRIHTLLKSRCNIPTYIVRSLKEVVDILEGEK